MPEPTDTELVSATKDLVENARKNGKLEHYTKGFVREQLEKQFDLPAGSLKPRKTVINEAIADAMSAVEEANEREKENVSPPSKKAGKKKASPGKAKARTGPEDVEMKDSEEELSVLDDGSPVKKKTKATATKGPKLASSKTKAKRADKNTDAFLSMVGLGPGSKSDEQAATMLLGPLASSSKKAKEPGSDSELSVLDDGPPKKKRKSKGEAEKPKRKGKRKSDEVEASGSDEAPKKKAKKSITKEPLDKNEEEIKRLKSFVLACGVRKPWKKELQDLSASQQINRIKKILAELGMTGRLSLEKAKDIKARRELAQEMEDVLEFDSKINGPRASRSQARAGKGKNAIVDEDEDEGDEEESASPGPSARTTKRPRANILAFLDDQSDSE